MDAKVMFFVLQLLLVTVSAMELHLSSRFSRMGRIGTGKEVTMSDKMRAKALGPNVCVQRIPIGFQTSCVMINYRHNCTMTSHYRSVFHCCPGFTAVLKKPGCPYELYVTNKTLIQELQSMGLVTLVALIEQAGLTKTLSTKTKYTVLAPNEKAFKKLGKESLKMLMEDKKALSKVLLYHVIRGKVPCSALEDNKLVDTVNGKKKVRVNLFLNDKFVTFNGVPVREANKGASNGIIHVIDGVLVSPTLSGEKMLAGINQVSLFRKALAMSNISISGGKTILAPTNKAFTKIDPVVFGRLLKSPRCLKNLLLNHVLPRPVFTTILDDKESLGLRTKEGTAYFMKRSTGTMTIGKAKVSMADMLATDSVIHVMDDVLVPTSALTVLEVAKQRGAHLFYKLMKESGIRSLLKESGKYTLFAPTDNALKKFIGNTSSSMSKMAAVLKYHIVPRSVQTCNFQNDMLLDTLDGKNKIRVNVYDYGLNTAVQGVCLSSSKCNVEACNGAVHLITEVLKPATDKLHDVINNDKRFTAFAAALQKANLEQMLKGDKPLTVFAPTNAAFSKFEPKELEDLLASGQRLRGLLKYHIVRGTYFRCAFSRECPVTSISGRSILIRMSKDMINVNRAELSGSEIVISNGIIYPIDRVLSPAHRSSLFSELWQMFGF